MRDIYLYEDCDVLKNLLNIRDKKLLDEAEADYVTYRLKEIAKKPLPGNYDYKHLLQMHQYIFQDMFEWAGQQRKLNIYKEEPVLGGLFIDYSDVFGTPKDAETVLSEMRGKQWEIMDTHEQILDLIKRTQNLENQRTSLYGIILIVMGISLFVIHSLLGGAAFKIMFPECC